MSFRSLFGVAGLIALALAVPLLMPRATADREPIPIEWSAPHPVVGPSPATAGPAGRTPAADAAQARSAPLSVSASFSGARERSSDYLQMARSLHGLAMNGDRDAQYQLFWILDYCQKQYRKYFGGPKNRRTLDEGLHWATANSHSLDAEEARLVHQRCHVLEDSDSAEFGERQTWLLKAVQARQPNSLLVLATKTFLDAVSLLDEEGERGRAEGRAMVAEALSSRDPEVIAEVANMLHWRTRSDIAEGETEAWWLAACQRGLDCSPGSERTRIACRFVANCQPYESLVDLMRRVSPDPIAADAKAAEIIRLIDAEDWAALGFGPRQGP